jgi:hypothetical protein
MAPLARTQHAPPVALKSIAMQVRSPSMPIFSLTQWTAVLNLWACEQEYWCSSSRPYYPQNNGYPNPPKQGAPTTQPAKAALKTAG